MLVEGKLPLQRVIGTAAAVDGRMGRLDRCLGIDLLGEGLCLACRLLRLVDFGQFEDLLQEADAIGPDL